MIFETFRFRRDTITVGGDLMTNLSAASRFDEIYDETSRPLLAFITSKCKNTSDISDIFQDTYLELYKVLENRGIDHIKNPRAFVFRIATRKIYRYYTILERVKHFLSLSAEDDEGSDCEPFDVDKNINLLEEIVINQVLYESAKKYILLKRDDIKKVLILFYDFEMTIPEIAKMLGISESNVKNKLYRTIKELREILK